MSFVEVIFIESNCLIAWHAFTFGAVAQAPVIVTCQCKMYPHLYLQKYKQKLVGEALV